MQTKVFNTLLFPINMNPITYSLQNDFWGGITQEISHLICSLQIQICSGHWLYLVIGYYKDSKIIYFDSMLFYFYILKSTFIKD